MTRFDTTTDGMPPPDVASPRVGSTPPPRAPEPDAELLTEHFKERFAHARKLVAELIEYATHFVTAKADGLKLSLQRIVMLAVLGMAAGIAGLAALIYATILLLSGLATALGILFGGRLWLGNIAVGGIVLGTIAVVVYLALGRVDTHALKVTKARYEARKAAQREQFGRDVTHV